MYIYIYIYIWRLLVCLGTGRASATDSATATGQLPRTFGNDGIRLPGWLLAAAAWPWLSGLAFYPGFWLELPEMCFKSLFL